VGHYRVAVALYACPCPGCPATEYAPIPVESDGDVVMAVCDGECGQQHPVADIKLLPA
jgi:hypothetical protein